MKDFIIFMINPLLYLGYKIINYKNFLKEKKEILFALSLAIINIYIPYNAGDSVRYAFKYYELILFPLKEAYQYYLPSQDKVYYGILFVFSRLKIPYNIFVIFISFIIFYIILSLLKNIKSKKLKMFYFLLLYMPLYIALALRFPLAVYIMVYALLQKNNLKKCVFVILSLLIHKAAVILLLIYIINIFLSLYINKFNIKFFIVLLIFLSNLFYFYLDVIYKYFSKNYIIEKLFVYSQTEYFNIFWKIVSSKSGFYCIFMFLAFVFSFLYLITSKNLKGTDYNFLLIFGSIIISFVRIIEIPYRFCWIFNIFFVIFLVKNNLKSKLLIFYKIFILCHTFMNIIIILYYSSIFYIKNYDVIPLFVYPTVVQTIGINNQYNKKIKTIAEIYPEKEKLGRSVMANLEEYYKLKGRNQK